MKKALSSFYAETFGTTPGQRRTSWGCMVLLATLAVLAAVI
jgi:hypothetical protein